MKTSLKVTLFSFICAITFVIFAYISGIEPLLWLAAISIAVSIISFTAWMCAKIFHRFRYSVNVILIIVFSVAALVSYILMPETIYIQTLEDIWGISYIGLAWLASICGCCVSILALIARVIFSKTPKQNSNTVLEEAVLHHADVPSDSAE